MATESSVADRARAALAGRFRRDVGAIRPEHDLRNDLGLDSLDMIEMLFEIEEVFDIDIPNEDLPQIATVGDVIAYVERRLAEPASKPVKATPKRAAPGETGTKTGTKAGKKTGVRRPPESGTRA